jgi:sulfate adenylyltransferase subunit 2
MLRTYYMNAISGKSCKFYPLSEYGNRDVLEYISENGLIWPEKYDHGQSSGDDISDVNYLLYLRENYPGDLARVFGAFPGSERILFEHDYSMKKAKTA